MDYIEVTFEISPFEEEFSDIIISEICELGFESYSSEEPHLKAYISKDLFVESHLKSILSGFVDYAFKVNYSLNLIVEQNWNAVWEADFESVEISSGVTSCLIKAHHQKAHTKADYIIDIDPDMSFGTGHHQTTAMMVEAIIEERISGLSVLDMGCGTGVLAILSAMRGAKSPVHAIDIEQRAVAASWNNARLNKVADQIEILCGDSSYIQSRKYDIILANINRNILLQDMEYYERGLKPGGKLFLSGFFETDLEMLVSAAAALPKPLKKLYTKTKEDWAMLALKKEEIEKN